MEKREQVLTKSAKRGPDTAIGHGSADKGTQQLTALGYVSEHRIILTRGTFFSRLIGRPYASVLRHCFA